MHWAKGKTGDQIGMTLECTWGINDDVGECFECNKKEGKDETGESLE